MPRHTNPVSVDNLAPLRRSLRALGDKSSLWLVRNVVKHAAEIVAEDAKHLQPLGTAPLGKRVVPERLRDSYRATTSGNTAFVKSPLAHAPIEEYRHGGPHAVNKALDAKADDVAKYLEQEFDKLARNQGWR